MEYEDHGDDPDTNSHLIDFWITDERFKDVELTDEEEAVIYERLVELSWED